jgi:hypothetical protein
VDGFQRKEIDKMLGWLRREPRFDAINIPFTLLIGLAKPLKEALGVPIACTLQGEDLFLENLQEPWKSQSLRLIREALSHVDVFMAVSDYYVGFMSGYLGIARERIKTVPIGINLEGHAPKSTRRAPPYTIGFFARIATGGSGCALVCPRHGYSRPATCSTSIARTSSRSNRACVTGGSQPSSVMRAPRIARARSRCFTKWT